MAEFEVAGKAYKSRRMDAMTEESVTRKLAPMLNMVAPALASLRSGEEGSAPGLGAIRKLDPSKIDPARMIATLTETIAGMPDENARFIIGSCLSVCEREQGSSWTPIWSKGAGRPLFDDIRAPQMYLISAKVMEDAFRDFMAALAPSFSDEGEASDTNPSTSHPG